MAKKEHQIVLQRWGADGLSYHINYTEHNSFFGEVYAIRNEGDQYAIIYQREFPAVSGPPGKTNLLLEAGKIQGRALNSFLEDTVLKLARGEAQRAAKKLGVKAVERK